MKPRKTAPTQKTRWSEAIAFRVWTVYRSHDEDQSPWKCAAAFSHLQDCLDYIAVLQDRGVDVVFQSPGDTRSIKATDRRVVYKPETVELAHQLLDEAGIGTRPRIAS